MRQDAFNATMHPSRDLQAVSTCTTCQFSEDFSNYWTAVMYFRAQNGSYKRVPQRDNHQFETANAGLTVYSTQDAIYDQAQKSKVTAFKPVGVEPLHSPNTRAGTARTWTARTTRRTWPTRRRARSRAAARARRATRCRSGRPCTRSCGTRAPSTSSTGPRTGATRSCGRLATRPGAGPTATNYVFGWKDDTLQRIPDAPCWFYTNCETESRPKLQSVEDMNKCALKTVVDEGY
ncbi:hypothetical protein VTK26DRAFT_4063 [Humicola hyalothermophila]